MEPNLDRKPASTHICTTTRRQLKAHRSCPPWNLTWIGSRPPHTSAPRLAHWPGREPKRANGENRPRLGIGIVYTASDKEAKRLPCNLRSCHHVELLRRETCLVHHNAEVDEEGRTRELHIFIRRGSESFIHNLQKGHVPVEGSVLVCLVQEQIRQVTGTAESQRSIHVCCQV